MKTVLYVEDSATSQLLMRKYINPACDMTITPSPQAALQLVREHDFDLIITDFLFPSGDATEFIQQVRQVSSPLQRPILVVSSSMDDALLDRVIKAGANDGLPKPLNTATFRAMVERMLTEPYVRSLERSISGISCVQWHDRDGFHEYCLELNLRVSGADKTEASKMMVAALAAHVRAGGTLGFAARERLITHLVHGEPVRVS